MASSTDIPPSFEPNVIDLVSVKDSTIANVSLYSSRAEITRVFPVNVRVGLNQINIGGLPNALDQQSLKVEGTGRATIHDVTISRIPVPVKPTTSKKLNELLRRKKKTEQAIDRCTLAIKSLQTYVGTLSVNNIPVSQVADVMKSYESAGEELDDRITELRAQLDVVNTEIIAERASFAGRAENEDLRIKATVGVFAEAEGEIEMKLIYAVHQASWNALYDVRVNMHTKEKPVELTYKASITQQTGEDWTDVNLTLETAEPTFGVDIPRLPPWTVSVYRPINFVMKSGKGGAFGGVRSLSATEGASSSTDMRCRREESSEEPEDIKHQGMKVSSKGNITATFGVPGKISVPSDGATHNVTIVKLNLDAKMRWISVPKKEAKTHLSAKIKNASEYTLLSGEASVYVDGSFIARTELPPVSPEESFDCPLGLDPSIRVTYHPHSKKITRSGFYNKTTTQLFTQRITIFNTKTTPIDNLKITDQFPVSDDSIITVKQMTPALVDVLKETTSGELKAPGPLRVASGVIAQWHGADEPDINVESLGRDGKFDWVCSVPAQGKINLFLQYEINAPPRTQLTGV